MSQDQNHDSDMDDFFLVTPEDAIPHLSNTKLNHLTTLYDTETYDAYVLLHSRNAAIRTDIAVAKAIEVVLALLDSNTTSMGQIQDEVAVQKKIKAEIEEEITETGLEMKVLMAVLESKDKELLKAKWKARKGRRGYSGGIGGLGSYANIFTM